MRIEAKSRQLVLHEYLGRGYGKFWAFTNIWSLGEKLWDANLIFAAGHPRIISFRD